MIKLFRRDSREWEVPSLAVGFAQDAIVVMCLKSQIVLLQNKELQKIRFILIVIVTIRFFIHYLLV